MHVTALENAERFFRAYPMPGATVLDIGSMDVNGSLRSICPHSYVGADLEDGAGVDVVLSDPYTLPFADNSQDIILSSSCFEHSEFFWLLFLEILRVLKPHGLFYLNAPSNGNIHRHPVDCWRFYPDAAEALVHWGERHGYHAAVLEYFTSEQAAREPWNDYVAVFVKDRTEASRYPGRITDEFRRFRNAHTGEHATAYTEDQSSWKWRIRQHGWRRGLALIFTQVIERLLDSRGEK